MRVRRVQFRGGEFGHVNVTPLIDVVMCLIVFFLIVGKLAADQRSNIRLPVSATGVEEKSAERLVINVVPARGGAAEGFRVVIDTREVAEAELESVIRDRLGSRPGAVVEIRGARELSYGAVARVIRACRGAGVESVRLATEKP